MRRRAFIAGLGGAATWPLVAGAQQGDRMRRIGVLMSLPADDAEGQARLAAFLQGLQQLGWTDGRNMQIDVRWGTGSADRMRKYAVELVALAPEVVLASSSAAVERLIEATRAIPIVFAGVSDPVAAGYVESLAQPAGNVTGFAVYEYSITGKWLELLKEIAPAVKRVAVLRESGIAAGPGQFGAIPALAPSLGVELRPIDVREAGDIERNIAAFAQTSDGGMIVGSPRSTMYRGLIIGLAAKHRLPAVYNSRSFAAAGGLVSYGPDFLDLHRRAATYVDRILKGEKPAEMPVQAPTKYELVINLKTAKALGLEVPHSLLARADEVIE
jgi:putative ABC transport system substrate-binding protein